jgi:hypothetical protein
MQNRKCWYPLFSLVSRAKGITLKTVFEVVPPVRFRLLKYGTQFALNVAGESAGVEGMKTCDRCGAEVDLLINGEPMCFPCQARNRRKLKVVPQEEGIGTSAQQGKKRILTMPSPIHLAIEMIHQPKPTKPTLLRRTLL